METEQPPFMMRCRISGFSHRSPGTSVWIQKVADEIKMEQQQTPYFGHNSRTQRWVKTARLISTHFIRSKRIKTDLKSTPNLHKVVATHFRIFFLIFSLKTTRGDFPELLARWFAPRGLYLPDQRWALTAPAKSAGISGNPKLDNNWIFQRLFRHSVVQYNELAVPLWIHVTSTLINLLKI